MERPVYANTVTVTTNDTKTEFVLTFSHKFPAYDVTNQQITTSEEVVSSVLIGGDLAKLLHNSLEQIASVEGADGEHH